MKSVSIISLLFGLAAAQGGIQQCQKHAKDLNICMVRTGNVFANSTNQLTGFEKTCMDKAIPVVTKGKCKGSPDDFKCFCDNLDDSVVEASACTNDCILKGTSIGIDIIAEVEKQTALCDCVKKAAP
jgi:hypothetical protein